MKENITIAETTESGELNSKVQIAGLLATEVGSGTVEENRYGMQSIVTSEASRLTAHNKIKTQLKTHSAIIFSIERMQKPRVQMC